MAQSILRRWLAVVGAALCLLYLGDYGVLRLRMARRSNSALGTVTLLYGAPLKDGKVRIFYDQPQIETCVHSIFPHLGYAACWWAKSHAVKIVSQDGDWLGTPLATEFVSSIAAARPERAAHRGTCRRSSPRC